MAIKKTVLSIEVFNGKYNFRYSGGAEPYRANLSPEDRKLAFKHDDRILKTLIECEPAYKTLAYFVHTIDRFYRREARKARKAEQEKNNEVNKE